MAMIPLDLPPGLYRNGTEFQSQGRWRDGNLVRWHEGALRPVGGWRQRGTVDVVGTPRSAISWTDNTNNRRVAFASHDTLWAMNAGNAVSDITPAGLTAGRVSATQNVGYGAGVYGDDLYGTPRSDTGTVLPATVWSLDTWGENLLACSPDDGIIYQWELDGAVDAAALSNAPVDCTGIVVTEERFVFALGAGGNPRKVQWSDQENNNLWAAAATNQAGDIELQTTAKILRGVRTRGQALILTERDAHTATYQGPPFVYGFEVAGTECGLIAPGAVVSIDQGVIWMGTRAFHTFAGGRVEQLPCEVADYLFSDMNMNQRSKITAVHNSTFREITWFYPSEESNENDRYVSYDYAENIWTTGTLDRTAGIDRGVFTLPMYFDAAGVLYEHEVGTSYSGATPFAESGPILLGAGDNVVSARYLYPDEKTLGDVTATFKTRFHATGTERDYGPYTLANPTSVRFTGRQIRMRVQGTTADWRVGVMRLEMVPGGLR